jgi:hypothetical protein
MFTHTLSWCEHRDLLLYNSLQLLTVFNFIDENDQLKVMCEHRDLLLYNNLQLLTVFNFIDEKMFTHYFKLVVLIYKVKNSK